MKIFTFLSAIYLLMNWSYGQDSGRSALFESQEPLALKLEFSFKELRKETDDSTYIDQLLYYRDGSKDWDSLLVQMRRRGHFRLERCYFPPVKLSIKKKQRKGTIFQDDKKLKLVLPCQNIKSANALIIKEYMCYKIYEKITPYSFNTRLTPIALTDHRNNKDRDFTLLAFLIEDDKRVAKRNDGEIMKNAVIHPLRLHDTTAVRHAIFQYLIANMDWSTVYQHNAKIMRTRTPYRIIPLAYDFDQAGFVDAAYAVLNPEFESATINPANVREDIKDRIYRGYCRENDRLMYFVRDEYLQLEDDIYDIIETHKHYLEERDYRSLRSFIEKFYKILADDQLFKQNIIDQCRTE